MLDSGSMDSTEAEMATALKNSDNLQPSSITLDQRIKALLLTFQCSFCDETFRGHLRLLRHIIRAHENAKIQIECGICRTVFSKPLYHAVHLFNKHLDGATPDLIENLKTEFGFYEKWKRKPEIGKSQKKKEKLKLLRKENDDNPRPKQRKPPPKKKDPKPKRKASKNQHSFDCSCGQKLKSQEHLEAHKSSHNLRIDPTIKCHLCAGAFDSVDDWLLHNCGSSLNSNHEQGSHVEPQVMEVHSRSPSPECADFSVALPASPQNCDSPVASPGSPHQNFDSPVASPASPPENFDSPVGSPASPPSPECDLSAPAPASPPRESDSFKALLKTFEKIIDDLPPPTQQPLDFVPRKDSRQLDDRVHDDDDMECGSPAEPPTSSPQNSEGQGINDPEVPAATTTAIAEESLTDPAQLQESQKEILVVDLVSSPLPVQQQNDSEPPETSSNVKKSKRDRKNPTGKQRKSKNPPPEDPEDLEVYTYLRKFNLQPFYNCDHCPARYKFKLHLVEHKHKYCRGPSIKSSDYNGCRMCGQEFSSKQELEAHMTSRHKESKPGSWACDSCENVYDWERALTFHKDSTHKIREKLARICRLCSKPCKSIIDMVKHHRAEHPENPHTVCVNCGEQFKNRYERREHEKKKHPGSSGNGGRIVCEICGKEMTKAALAVHMKRVHAEKNFLCTNCGASFGSLDLLQSHEFMHLPKEDKPLACKFCSYRAAQTVSFDQHMARRHLDHDGFAEYEVDGKEKPFICDQCGKAYTSEVALEEHKIFHGKRTYKCRKCGEFMFTRYHLVAHQQEFHVPKKKVFPEPRACPNCPKKFTSRTYFYVHQRTCGYDPSSTRIRAKKCDECGKIYKTKKDLEYHIRSAHLKTFAYHCEVCGKGSNSRSNLKAHMKIHGGGFECEVCKLKFPNFPELSKHTLDEHGRDPIRMYRKSQGKLKRIVESLRESSETAQEEHVYDAAK